MRWDGLGWIHRREGVGGKEGVSLMHNFHFHVLVAGRFEPTSLLSHVSCEEKIYIYATTVPNTTVTVGQW